MILVDREIEQLLHKYKGIKCTPQVDEELQIQPSSLDLRLGNTFSYIDTKQDFIDLADKIDYKQELVSHKYRIPPNGFVLAETLEYIQLPDNICAFVEGRSSIGRAGLQIENAGWVDNGFEGTITLELKNLSNKPIIIEPSMRICQLVFSRTKMAEKPYNGKYLKQKGATGSKMYQDSELN